MIRLALLGDIGFFGRYCMRTNPDVVNYFQPLIEYLGRHDIVVGNLEVPFAEGLKPVGQKSAFLCSQSKNVDLLKALGVSAVTLANNHSYDFGRRGVEQTTKILDEAGIGWFGVGPESVWEWQGKGEKVRFRGFCSYSTNPMGLRRTPGKAQLEEFNPVSLKASLQKDRSDGWLPVLSMHSGEEHVDMPSPLDRKVARYLASGVDYLHYGHSAHVIQGVEKINDSLIFYSLGNFCFDDVYTPRSSAPLIRQTEQNRTGLIASVSINKGEIVSYSPCIFRTDPDGVFIFAEEDAASYVDRVSRLLSLEQRRYEDERNQKLRQRISARKRSRNLSWYLSRLNLNSAGIILRAKRNQWYLKRTVILPLGKEGQA